MSFRRKNNTADPRESCPRLADAGAKERGAVLAAGCIACPGPNFVMYYDRRTREPNGELIPDTREFCCQDPVELETGAGAIIDQQVGGRGQLLLKIARNNLGWRVLAHAHVLDVPEAIPSSVVVIGRDGEQILRTPLQDVA
jgi:hypothetical protein